MAGTLLQKQGDEWVVIGYHSKRLPKSAKNFGVTELELTGLLVNIHGFIIVLKYQKGSEMHTSDALSRLHNFTDTPDQKHYTSTSKFLTTLHTTLHRTFIFSSSPFDTFGSAALPIGTHLNYHWERCTPINTTLTSEHLVIQNRFVGQHMK